MPVICGSTTDCTKAQAIAASTALPPRLRTSAPASTASGWAATIIPAIGSALPAKSCRGKTPELLQQHRPGLQAERDRRQMEELVGRVHVLVGQVEAEHQGVETERLLEDR